jgi:hypothetical protein
VAEQFVDPVGHPIAERMLQVMGLLVCLRPSETDDLGQQPLGERVAAERALGGDPALIGEVQLARVRLVAALTRRRSASRAAITG